MGVRTDRIKFNVRGTIFETTATTLAIAGRNSYFGALFDGDWNLQPQNSGEHFIDRNPNCFSILLDLLSTGELFIPSNIPERLLYKEAQFYGLLDHVRLAKWGRFDGNRLHLKHSVRGRAPGTGIVRAGPDGGCCVAHGGMVHVYDWMIEEHPPINPDWGRVNDVGWIDSDTIVVAACGMGMFNLSGELKHKLQISHHDQVKSYTAGALSFSPDRKIFSSCISNKDEDGIGVFDQITGKQIDFYYEKPTRWFLSYEDHEPTRLQWLNGKNCLLVATLHPRKDFCYIRLLDFRDKNSMIWSWSDIKVKGVESFGSASNKLRVWDAIAMEETGSICVVNDYSQLGFIELRRGGSVRLSSCNRLKEGILGMSRLGDKSCLPKLALNDGKLFLSFKDMMGIFSGPNRDLTSRLEHEHGGSICDFSIGGDRLFVLHNEANVFDIWESPLPPVL